MMGPVNKREFVVGSELSRVYRISAPAVNDVMVIALLCGIGPLGGVNSGALTTRVYAPVETMLGIKSCRKACALTTAPFVTVMSLPMVKIGSLSVGFRFSNV